MHSTSTNGSGGSTTDAETVELRRELPPSILHSSVAGSYSALRGNSRRPGDRPRPGKALLCCAVLISD